MRPLALGLDPGFKNLGVAVLDIVTEEVLALRLLRTKKLAGARVTDDNVRRLIETGVALDELFQEFPTIKVVCSEALSYPRNAAVIAKQSMQWGLMIGKIQQYGCDFMYALPQDLKKAVTGSRKASKEDIETALSRLFSSQDLSKLYGSVSPGMRNHFFDALGAIVACRVQVDYQLLRVRYK